MKKVLLGCLIIGVAAQSQAAIWGFSVPLLHGGNEVPPNGSQAYGSASFTIDDSTWAVVGSMTTVGLPYLNASGGANVTGAHIHSPATTTQNGPVVFNLISNSLPGFPMDFTGGITVYAWSGTLGGNQAQILSDLVNGLGYINVHSVAIPSGEIRGQIDCVSVVPEPASIAALSLGGLALLRRRRK